MDGVLAESAVHSWSDFVKFFLASGFPCEVFLFSSHFALFNRFADAVNQLLLCFFLPVDRFGRCGLLPFTIKFGRKAVGDISFLGEINNFLGDGDSSDLRGDINGLVAQKMGNFFSFLGES